MSLDLLFQYLVAGITYGTIYAIVAIGFNIIYNTTGIINFAQGEFVMLGGMIGVTLHALLPMPVAIAGAVIATMLVGALIEMLFIRWLRRPSVLRLIIITIGLSIAIRELALLLWGEGVRALPYFTGTAVTSLSVGDVHISPQVLWVLGISAVMVAALNFFFARTLLGRQMRACACNREAAQLMRHQRQEHGDPVLCAERGHRRSGRLCDLAHHLRAIRQRQQPGLEGVHCGHFGRSGQQHGCRCRGLAAWHPGVVLHLGHARRL